MTRTFLSMLALLTLLSPAARANNQFVSDCSDNGLRTAVAQAQSTGGGTISFTCGPATIVLQNGPLPLVTANTTVEGGGTITISGNNPSGGSTGTRIFNVSATGTLTLNNITIRDAYANGDGGAVSSGGTLNVNNSRFLYNANSASFSGSAIYSTGPLNVSNSEFANNTGGGGAVKPRSGNAVTKIGGSNFHDNTSAASAGGGYGGAMQLHDAPYVTVDNCTFSTNDAGTSGGAIYVGSASALTLTNSTVTSNRALKLTGGGLGIAGTATISNTQITTNVAAMLGGGISTEAGAQLTITGGAITGNKAFDYKLVDYNSSDKGLGGGIRSLGALTISGCTIKDNVANVAMHGSLGGGIYHETGALTLTNVTIQGNHAIHGAGVYMASGNATINGGAFTSNFAESGDGGGLYIGSGSASVSGATFTGNYAVFSGGGISNAGTLTVTNGIITTNGAYNGGGGLMNYGTATLNTSTVSNNNASGGGEGYGGGANNSGTLTLNNSTVDGNTANIDGGGIYNSGGLYLNTSTVKNNIANGGDEVESGAGGGGIFNSNGVTLIRSTVSGNKTNKLDGGGLYNYKGVASVGNSTFSGNTAAGDGGGIISNFASTVLNHVTVSGNSAAAGGGIYNLTGDSSKTIVLASTLIANNSSGYNCAQFAGSQDLKSYGYNLSDDNSFNTFCSMQFQPGDVNNADAKLAPLAGNGGATLTHLPQPGSAALDAIPNGQNGCGTMVDPDQRGVARPQGPACDIGSVEVRPIDYVTPTPTPTPTSTPTATPTPKPATLANISTRLRVEAGDNALIAGLIVTGTPDKKVIIRGIGPSLGLADQLGNPTLELYSGATLLKSNDDWQNSSPADKQAIIDSTIPPTNDLESAIVATLPANGAGYTAVLRGANNGTGIGVIQVYDLDRIVDSKLANISTRGFVSTGDNVLFAGMIVLGQSAQKVIIRALGPSVPVPGNMADPTLELYDGNGALLDSNDNWVDSLNKQAIIDSTIPPTNDFESAIVATLPANGAQYTAIVRGVNSSTGIAVVEVYALN